MPSLKAIRKRIGSVRNTQKITRALKMVATARLRRAQEQIQAFRPYAKKLREVALELISEEMESKERASFKKETEIAGSKTDEFAPFFEERPEQNIRLVLVTLDRGLSGAFNSNIYRKTEQILVEKEGSEIEFFVLGRKGMEYVKRRLRERNNPGHQVHSWQKCQLLQSEPAVDAKTFMSRSQELATRLTQDFLEKKTDAVYIVFNEFHSIARQTVQVHRLLPLSLEAFSQANSIVKPDEVSAKNTWEFLFEPTPKELAQKLLPLYVETEIQRMFLESIASQFGAQMSAMDNASRNAKEMITDLTQQMNRARQAAITKELLEIISGAEALKG